MPYREIEISEISNGYILKDKAFGGGTYAFKTFEELVNWIKENFQWD